MLKEKSIVNKKKSAIGHFWITCSGSDKYDWFLNNFDQGLSNSYFRKVDVLNKI